MITAAKGIVLAGLLAAVSAAYGQTYPNKPVRLVIPFTAGSAIDVIGRPAGERLAKLWGHPVVIDNRAGAGGLVGANIISKSNPDGYTLLLHTNAHATNAALYGDLPFDPIGDFRAVAAFASQPYLLVVNPASGPKSVRELIARAKAKPGAITFGSAGVGSGTHFVGEKFRLAGGFEVVHVPYKGGPEANTDVMSGRIDYWFPPQAAAIAFVPGKLAAIAVSTATRSLQLPNVPTLAESGLPGFDTAFWSGIWAPARTADATANKIAVDVAQVLGEPEIRERFAKLGVQPMKMTPAEFAQMVRREIDDSFRIVKAAGIKAQ